MTIEVKKFKKYKSKGFQSVMVKKGIYLLKINDLYRLCSKVVLLLLILLPPVWSVGLKIDLRVGSVQGGIEKVQGSADGGKNYASFSGIPYAEPPVGKLRFKVCT